MLATNLRLQTALVGTLLLLSTALPALADPAPGTDGADGAPISGTGPSDSSTGDNGTNGPDGGDGGRGGDITSTISSGGHVTATSYGGEGGHADSPGNGQGGNGGAGGDIHLTIDGTVAGAMGISQGADAGYASDGIMPTASGGAGGAVTVIIAGTASGAVSVSSDAGDAKGNNGFDPQFTGAAGGLVTVMVSGTVGGALHAKSSGGDSTFRGGRGGDVSITVASTGAIGSNLTGATEGGGDDNGSHGIVTGEPGAVSITIAGTVNGDVRAETWNGGTVSVLINGGVVRGTIDAYNANPQADPNVSTFTSTLTFDFDVASQADFDAAAAVLSAQSASGAVTINGNAYQWRGFTSLVNQLRNTSPTDKVVVTVQAAAATSEALPPVESSTGPVAASCGSTPFRSVRMGDGTVALFQHQRGGDILIGRVTAGSFRAADAAAGWTVTVGAGGQTIDIATSDGASSASCTFG